MPLGVVAVGVVVARLLVFTVASLRHAVQQSRHDQLSLDLLKQRIASVKKAGETSQVAWNGYRKFEVSQRIDEALGIKSYVLVPHDGKPLPGFKPGQFLTLSLRIPGRDKPVVRCYSLSDPSNEKQYRITIKGVSPPPDSPLAPPGLVSNYFHEQIQPGDIIDVQAPRGQFVCETQNLRPAVMIAGGIGVTPLLCMAKCLAAQQVDREVIFFYGMRDGREHAFKEELTALAAANPNLRLIVCYSRPTKQDEQHEGRDYHYTGRMNLELLKTYLYSTNYEFYLCGPASMMESLSAELLRWGVAEQDIHSEAFGPATVNKVHKIESRPQPGQSESAGFQVSFARSKKTCNWDPSVDNLLDLAESVGVSIESGCRAGNCGTCLVAIKSGRVKSLSEHGAETEDGTCLACVAVPADNVVLDA